MLDWLKSLLPKKKKTKSYSDTFTEGLMHGIMLGRDHPKRSVEELMADIEETRKRLEKLPTKDLKELANGPRDIQN